MRLADPWLLLLLALVAVLLSWARQRRRVAAVHWPSLEVVRAVAPAGGGRRRAILGVLRAVALGLVVVALARPQLGTASTKVHREGVDVVLAVDVSGSMLAEDFTLAEKRANRLDAVKSVVREFVAARPQDRIGLVVFAARPYTQAPLTLDHGWLLQNLDRAKTGMIEDGTAVGSALATATNRLRASTAPSKFVVLLTDGQSNAGRITPQTAADAAAALGIKVYTIGAGTRGMAPYPVQDMFGNTVYRPVQVDVDEPTLEAIAKTTGGRYFRATDTQSLRDIYQEIDAAEKAPFEAPQFLEHHEMYPWLVWPALVLLLLEVGLAETVLRKLP
ncbi:MAG TPA: VWA domain-containing protein [Candidatus Binatia bacterium]|nr:VWA domain-containing protein [Candidatus Binatia bacterium]